MVFPEALQSADEFERFAKEISVPLIANLTEFGKSPLLTVKELGDLGFAAVLFPVTIFRVAMKAAENALVELADAGSQPSLMEAMQTRAELYELIDYEAFEERDRAYFGENP